MDIVFVQITDICISSADITSDVVYVERLETVLLSKRGGSKY